MKGICYIWSRGHHFSPSLLGDSYLKLVSKSDLRVEISESIVRYDALAPRTEVLLFWYFVGSCAATLKMKFLPYSWRKYLHRADQIQHASIKLVFLCIVQSAMKCRGNVRLFCHFKIIVFVKNFSVKKEFLICKKRTF